MLVALTATVIFTSIAWSRWEPYTFLHGDGAFYANIAKTLWRDGSLDQGKTHPRSWLEDDLGWNRNVDQGWSNVSLGKDGRWLPKHSFVMPALALPLYGLFGPGGLLAFHVAMLVVLCTAGYAIAARLMSPSAAALGALLAASQPLIVGDVYSFNNDAFYAACLTLGTAAYLASIRYGEPSGDAPDRPWLEVFAGLCLGVGVVAKVTNLVFVAPLGLWLLARKRGASIGRCLAGFAVPVVFFSVSNTVLFGSPLSTSYGSIIVRQDRVLTTESVGVKFNEPLRAGLVRITTDPREGLLPKAPLLISIAVLGGLGLCLRRDSRVLGVVFLAVLAAFLAVQAKYAYTYARFFLPLVGLSVAPLGWVLLATGRGLSALGRGLRPTVLGRVNPAFAAAVMGPLAALGLARWDGDRGPWRLSEHADTLDVRQGTRRCDYFNNLHQKFECGQDGGPELMWGRALGKQCAFGGSPRSLLFLHPPLKAASRTATVRLPTGGRLALEYGLAETSRHHDVALEVLVNGQPVALPPVARRDVLYRHDVEGVPSGAVLELRVAAPGDWRHLCFDATLVGD